MNIGKNVLFLINSIGGLRSFRKEVLKTHKDAGKN